MSVIDASALIEILLKDETASKSRPFLTHDLFAPAILIPETVNALKKSVRLKSLTKAVAREKVALLSVMPVDLVPMQRLSLDIWELSDSFSAYDACYVSLSKQLDHTLITTDRKLAREAQRFVDVHFLS